MHVHRQHWFRWLPAEPRVLIGIGVLAGLLLLFAKIVEDVVEHESGAFDRAILTSLRTAGDLSRPVGPAWLQSAFTNITSLGSPTIITLVTLVAVAYLAVAGRRKLALLTMVSIAAGALAEKAMKLGFDRARPDIVPHLVTVHTLSFPSGHAMLSAVTYLTLGALLARAQTRWGMRIFVLTASIFVTLLIGFSRVYLGVHWPTDVLAGWSIGAAWALVFWLIAESATERAD